MVKENYSKMLNDFDKPAKFYRTMNEAFKDADYACAVEVGRNRSSQNYAVMAWVVVALLATMLAIFMTV